MVYGFPSKLAALQFEWAWQKAEVSRHLRRPTHATGPGTGCEPLPTVENDATQAGQNGGPDDPSEKVKGKPASSQRAISYFPRKSLNGSPMMKIAILQRLVVSLPFRHLALSVQLFSKDARTWWDTNLQQPERSYHLDPERRRAPGSAAAIAVRKRLSVKAIAETFLDIEAGQSLPAIVIPNLDGVHTDLRVEGVDGKRLFRENDEDAPEKHHVGPIKVDDGA